MHLESPALCVQYVGHTPASAASHPLALDARGLSLRWIDPRCRRNVREGWGAYVWIPLLSLTLLLSCNKHLRGTVACLAESHPIPRGQSLESDLPTQPQTSLFILSREPRQAALDTNPTVNTGAERACLWRFLTDQPLHSVQIKYVLDVTMLQSGRPG